MNILLVTETLAAGGAETFVVRLANALSANHKVTIAVLHGEMVNPAVAARIGASIRVERLVLPAKRWQFRADRLLRMLRIDRSLVRSAQRRWVAAVARRTEANVLHSHLLKADRLASETAGTNRSLRHVITLHGDYAPFLLGQADPQMLKVGPQVASILASADAIAAICSEQAEFVARHYPAASAKTRLILNGYEPWQAHRSPPLKRPASKLVFGMVSRGVELKGWAKAVAAFACLPANSAELILVGEGPAIDRLRRVGVPEGVRFAGFSADPVEWIDQVDVGLLPSEFPHESLPTVVMEYLFCGKPVIATDVGEIGAMMRAPGGDLAGILLEFDGKAIATGDLAAAMRTYLNQPELRLRHAALAPAAFAKFDMAACAAAYAGLYAEVGAAPINSSTSASH